MADNMPIIRNHIGFLTAQYIGTCRSDYTKGMLTETSESYVYARKIKK